MDALTEQPQPTLRLRQIDWDRMRADVEELAPEEACGLVAGKRNLSCDVISITNIHHSPARFWMDPEEQLQAFNHIDEQGWELLAIYHSHPYGPPAPSVTDIAEAAYPGVIHLIWSTSGEDWICKGFLIEKSRVEEIPIHIVR